MLIQWNPVKADNFFTPMMSALEGFHCSIPLFPSFHNFPTRTTFGEYCYFAMPKSQRKKSIAEFTLDTLLTAHAHNYA